MMVDDEFEDLGDISNIDQPFMGDDESGNSRIQSEDDVSESSNSMFTTNSEFTKNDELDNDETEEEDDITEDTGMGGSSSSDALTSFSALKVVTSKPQTNGKGSRNSKKAYLTPKSRSSSKPLSGETMKSPRKTSKKDGAKKVFSTRAKTVSTVDGKVGVLYSEKIECFGVIDPRPSYHNEDEIWPIGFTKFATFRLDPTLEETFKFQILDGGDEGPLFKVTYLPSHVLEENNKVLKPSGSDSQISSSTNGEAEKSEHVGQVFQQTKPRPLKFDQVLEYEARTTRDVWGKVIRARRQTHKLWYTTGGALDMISGAHQHSLMRLLSPQEAPSSSVSSSSSSSSSYSSSSSSANPSTIPSTGATMNEELSAEQEKDAHNLALLDEDTDLLSLDTNQESSTQASQPSSSSSVLSSSIPNSEEVDTEEQQLLSALLEKLKTKKVLTEQIKLDKAASKAVGYEKWKVVTPDPSKPLWDKETVKQIELLPNAKEYCHSYVFKFFNTEEHLMKQRKKRARAAKVLYDIQDFSEVLEKTKMKVSVQRTKVKLAKTTASTSSQKKRGRPVGWSPYNAENAGMGDSDLETISILKKQREDERGEKKKLKQFEIEEKRRQRTEDLEARRSAKEDDKLAKEKAREVEKMARAVRKQLESEVHKLRISTRLAVNSHVTSAHNLYSNTKKPTPTDARGSCAVGLLSSGGDSQEVDDSKFPEIDITERNQSFLSLKGQDAVEVIRIWNFLNTFRDCLKLNQHHHKSSVSSLVSFSELCDDIAQLEKYSCFGSQQRSSAASRSEAGRAEDSNQHGDEVKSSKLHHIAMTLIKPLLSELLYTGLNTQWDERMEQIYPLNRLTWTYSAAQIVTQSCLKKLGLLWTSDSFTEYPLLLRGCIGFDNRPLAADKVFSKLIHQKLDRYFENHSSTEDKDRLKQLQEKHFSGRANKKNSVAAADESSPMKLFLSVPNGNSCEPSSWQYHAYALLHMNDQGLYNKFMSYTFDSMDEIMVYEEDRRENSNLSEIKIDIIKNIISRAYEAIQESKKNSETDDAMVVEASVFETIKKAYNIVNGNDENGEEGEEKEEEKDGGDTTDSDEDVVVKMDLDKSTSNSDKNDLVDTDEEEFDFEEETTPSKKKMKNQKVSRKNRANEKKNQSPSPVKKVTTLKDSSIQAWKARCLLLDLLVEHPLPLNKSLSEYHSQIILKNKMPPPGIQNNQVSSQTTVMASSPLYHSATNLKLLTLDEVTKEFKENLKEKEAYMQNARISVRRMNRQKAKLERKQLKEEAAALKAQALAEKEASKLTDSDDEGKEKNGEEKNIEEEEDEEDDEEDDDEEEDDEANFVEFADWISPPTETELKLFAALEVIISHPKASAFIDPLDPDIVPDYYAKIARPIFLFDIKQNLFRRKYDVVNNEDALPPHSSLHGIELFINDFNQVLENCRCYNLPGTWMDASRITLSLLFNTMMNSWFKEDFNNNFSSSSSSSSETVMNASMGLSVENVESIFNDDTCLICCAQEEKESNSRQNVLLICDRCDGKHHMSCLKPKLKEVPSGSWFCPRCIEVDIVNTVPSFKHLQKKEDKSDNGVSHNNNSLASSSVETSTSFVNSHRTFGLPPRLDPRVCSASASSIIEEGGVIISQLQTLQILSVDCEEWGSKDWITVLDTLVDLASGCPMIEASIAELTKEATEQAKLVAAQKQSLELKLEDNLVHNDVNLLGKLLFNYRRKFDGEEERIDEIAESEVKEEDAEEDEEEEEEAVEEDGAVMTDDTEDEDDFVDNFNEEEEEGGSKTPSLGATSQSRKARRTSNESFKSNDDEDSRNPSRLSMGSVDESNPFKPILNNGGEDGRDSVALEEERGGRSTCSVPPASSPLNIPPSMSRSSSSISNILTANGTIAKPVTTVGLNNVVFNINIKTNKEKDSVMDEWEDAKKRRKNFEQKLFAAEWWRRLNSASSMSEEDSLIAGKCVFSEFHHKDVCEIVKISLSCSRRCKLCGLSCEALCSPFIAFDNKNASNEFYKCSEKDIYDGEFVDNFYESIKNKTNGINESKEKVYIHSCCAIWMIQQRLEIMRKLAIHKEIALIIEPALLRERGRCFKIGADYLDNVYWLFGVPLSSHSYDTSDNLSCSLFVELSHVRDGESNQWRCFETKKDIIKLRTYLSRTNGQGFLEDNLLLTKIDAHLESAGCDIKRLYSNDDSNGTATISQQTSTAEAERYSVGDIVNVCKGASKWIARVVHVEWLEDTKEHIYRVCYRGWSRRFDEYVCLDMLSELDASENPTSSISSMSLNLQAKHFIHSSHRLSRIGTRDFDIPAISPTTDDASLSGYVGTTAHHSHRYMSELKLAMLMIEAALPFGCCSTSSAAASNEEGWNEMKAFKWIWSVKHASSVVKLMELFIILEESIENGWLLPGTLTSLYKTLPARADALTSISTASCFNDPRSSGFSSLAMRIFTFDSIFQYDKVVLFPSSNSGVSGQSVFVSGGSVSRFASLRKSGVNSLSAKPPAATKSANKVKTRRATLTPPM